MTKEERYNLILDTLIKRDQIQVTDLAALLNVSSVTIRKDLTELEKANRLYRSHGKAILINPYINNRSVSEKEKLCTVEKHRIGEYAASRISADDSIIIGPGSTTAAFARCIQPRNRLTAITSSLQVADVLAGVSGVEIIMLGGIIRQSSRSVVGRSAEQMLSDFSCSQLFLGVDGIDLEFGITNADMREAELNRAMMRATQKTVVLADSSKFRRRGFSKICGMDEVDLIITDSNIPDRVARRMEELGIEYVVVDVAVR